MMDEIGYLLLSRILKLQEKTFFGFEIIDFHELPLFVILSSQYVVMHFLVSDWNMNILSLTLLLTQMFNLTSYKYDMITVSCAVCNQPNLGQGFPRSSIHCLDLGPFIYFSKKSGGVSVVVETGMRKASVVQISLVMTVMMSVDAKGNDVRWLSGYC